MSPSRASISPHQPIPRRGAARGRISQRRAKRTISASEAGSSWRHGRLPLASHRRETACSHTFCLLLFVVYIAAEMGCAFPVPLQERDVRLAGAKGHLMSLEASQIYQISRSRSLQPMPPWTVTMAPGWATPILYRPQGLHRKGETQLLTWQPVVAFSRYSKTSLLTPMISRSPELAVRRNRTTFDSVREMQPHVGTGLACRKIAKPAFITISESGGLL